MELASLLGNNDDRSAFLNYLENVAIEMEKAVKLWPQSSISSSIPIAKSQPQTAFVASGSVKAPEKIPFDFALSGFFLICTD